jgi:L-ascorbate metabolism protein UlaG (beta-lactamase superfamily)
MQVTFLGHAAAQLSAAGSSVLIDPFLAAHPTPEAAAAALSADVVVITHAHGDHIGVAPEIAARSGAVVVSSVEIAKVLAGRHPGLRTLGANIGGAVAGLPDGVALRFTPAWHSSSFEDGTYGGMPMGVLVELAGWRVYHAGDTARFGDMALIGEAGLDLALLPIGGHYTMDPSEALLAVKLLRPRFVVPIHFGTFPVIDQDGEAFAAAVDAAEIPSLVGGGLVRVTLLAAGESWTLPGAASRVPPPPLLGQT